MFHMFPATGYWCITGAKFRASNYGHSEYVVLIPATQYDKPPVRHQKKGVSSWKPVCKHFSKRIYNVGMSLVDGVHPIELGAAFL